MKVERTTRPVKGYGDTIYSEDAHELCCACGWRLLLERFEVSTVRELRREMLHRLSCDQSRWGDGE